MNDEPETALQIKEDGPMARGSIALLISTISLIAAIANVSLKRNQPPPHPTSVVASTLLTAQPNSKDIESRQLLREIARLRAEASKAKHRQNIQLAENPSSPEEESIEENQQKSEDAKRRTQQRFRALMATQDRDPAWADGEEQRIRSIVEGSDPDVKAESISCLRTLCHVVLRGVSTTSRSSMNLMRGHQAYSTIDLDEGGAQVIYIMRDGFPLPAIDM